MYAYASLHTDIRQRNREQELDSYGAAMFLDPVKTPEEDLIERDEVGCIVAELADLPARTERMVRMYYGIGCEPHTFKQVGAEFGLTGQAVRAIIVKGESTLTRRLKKRLRPEIYKAESAARTRELREEQAREAEWAAEDARRRAEFLTVAAPVYVARTWREVELAAEYDRREQQETEAATLLQFQRSEQIRYIKDKIRAMGADERAQLRARMVEENNGWFLNNFNSMLIGDNDG